MVVLVIPPSFWTIRWRQGHIEELMFGTNEPMVSFQSVHQLPSSKGFEVIISLEIAVLVVGWFWIRTRYPLEANYDHRA